MKVFAKFDEIPSRTFQDIKETKRHGHTFVLTDNMKTVFPPTNTVCGGYKDGNNFNTVILLLTLPFTHCIHTALENIISKVTGIQNKFL